MGSPDPDPVSSQPSEQETGVVSAEGASRPNESSTVFDGTESPTTPLPQYPPQTEWPDDSFVHEKPLYGPESTNASSTSNLSLDKDGFTRDEREEHRRTVRYLLTLKILALSRIALRVIAVFISLAAFILITVTVILFVKFTKHHSLSEFNDDYDDEYGNTHVHLTPATFFASVSGVFVCLSFAVNILCCIFPSMRKITPVSNLVFGLIALAGVAGWLGSCLALEHNRSSGTNFWYAICEVGELYQDNGGQGLPPSGKQFVGFCNNTSNSWKLAVLQVVIEGLTFINVLVAWLMIKTGIFRH